MLQKTDSDLLTTSPLKTSIKYGFTPEEYGSYSLRVWVYPWRFSWNLKLQPKEFQVFSDSSPKEILNFYN